MDEADFLLLFVIFMKILEPIRVLNLATQKRDVALIKGILRPIFCIDINTGNGKLCKIYEKILFSKYLSFIDLFYRYHYPGYFIYSDYM